MGNAMPMGGNVVPNNASLPGSPCVQICELNYREGRKEGGRGGEREKVEVMLEQRKG